MPRTFDMLWMSLAWEQPMAPVGPRVMDHMNAEAFMAMALHSKPELQPCPMFALGDMEIDSMLSTQTTDEERWSIVIAARLTSIDAMVRYLRYGDDPFETAGAEWKVSGDSPFKNLPYFLCSRDWSAKLLAAPQDIKLPR